MTDKYLVRIIKHNSGEYTLALVLEVLKVIDTEYGTVVITRYTDTETSYLDTEFLHELEEDGYKFSNDSKYEGYING